MLVVSSYCIYAHCNNKPFFHQYTFLFLRFSVAVYETKEQTLDCARLFLFPAIYEGG